MRTKEDLDKYINDMRDALRYRGARDTFFPPNKDLRKERNIRLAREVGHALADFSPEDVDNTIGSLYGAFIVANSFDSVGVQIDSKTFAHHVNLARQREG